MLKAELIIAKNPFLKINQIIIDLVKYVPPISLYIYISNKKLHFTFLNHFLKLDRLNPNPSFLF